MRKRFLAGIISFAAASTAHAFQTEPLLTYSNVDPGVAKNSGPEALRCFYSGI